LLGVSHVELLGYRDSGMAGWAGNDRADAFCNVPLDDAAAALLALFERYEPQVLVTYDANGGYGHPDHVQTHRVAMAALGRSEQPSKVYFTARSQASARRLAEFRQQLQLPPRRRPEGSGGPPPEPPAGIPEAAITTVIDVRVALDRKRAALEAHASQLADTVWVRASKADFDELFGYESFVRSRDCSGASLPETDLFAGL
jgi:LmbE family N-acetylglucosaminyl deacetylase